MNILNPKRNFIVEHEGYVFNYKVPTPSMKIEIDTRVAKRLKGSSLDAIPETTYWYSVALENLNLCLTPVDKDNKDFIGLDWGDVDDYEFVSSLYQKCVDVEKKFREELKKNNSTERSDIGNDAGHIHNEVLQDSPRGGSNDSRFRTGAENVSNGVRNDTGGFRGNEEADFDSASNRDGKKSPTRRVSVSR